MPIVPSLRTYVTLEDHARRVRYSETTFANMPGVLCPSGSADKPTAHVGDLGTALSALAVLAGLSSYKGNGDPDGGLVVSKSRPA